MSGYLLATIIVSAMLALLFYFERTFTAGSRETNRTAEHAYVDEESGTLWMPPTAYAYAQVCKSLDKYRARIAELEAELKQLNRLL